MRPLRVVSCFASVAAAVIGLALAAPVAAASPTPDPAPAGLTPTPDPVGKSATTPRTVKRGSVSHSSTTRRSSGATTRTSSTRTETRRSQSTSTKKTVATLKTTPRKQATLAAKPILTTLIIRPAVAPAAAPTGDERNGDLLLSAAIALGGLVLASLSLVGLTRRMRTDLPAG